MVAQKLTQLRQLMKQNSLDFYFVPAADAHNNEYVPDAWQRRAWLSGFTGSAGDALVGTSKGYLWTDGRYFLQANLQLDPLHFQLMKQHQGAAPIEQWLQAHSQNIRIGVDPRVISVARAERWQATLAKSHSHLVAIEDNLVDQIWQDRPKLITHPIEILPEKYAGKSVSEKLKEVRIALDHLGADNLVISPLDAIAWLFNIRGRDIAFNPLVISYAIIEHNKTILFLDQSKLTDNDKFYFEKNHITLADYADIANHCQQLSGKTLLDPNSSSLWLKQQLTNCDALLKESPITLMKACKNSKEQDGMREAHRRDALALIKFFYWLEKNWRGLTELDAAEKIDSLRREDKFCQDLSFNTISAYGDHGAIIHYSVDAKSNRALGNTSLFLLDSGGQYLQGTTDVTRTIHLGQPTELQKRHYTLVLKGHLALGHAIFPHGTCGEHLDVLARLPLWKQGLDYAHGTGHGVGCYLCVHEGPQRIAKVPSNVPLLPGMMLSNEPGVYIEGEYGIRIENVCVVVEKMKYFYGFEDLTLVPFARNLIAIDLLFAEEIRWINDYHQKIYQALAKELPKEIATWLAQQTRPL